MTEPTTRETIQRLKQRKAELLSQKVQRPAYNQAFVQGNKPAKFIPRRPKKKILCITTGIVYEGMDAAGMGEGVNSHTLSNAMSKYRIKNGIGVTGTVDKGNRKEWKLV